MKAATKIKMMLQALAVLLLISCSTGRYPNTGTSSDRTGTNGATNGNGKVPKDKAHDYKY